MAAHRERTRSIVVVEYDRLHIKQALSSNWLEDDTLEGIALFVLHGKQGILKCIGNVG